MKIKIIAFLALIMTLFVGFFFYEKPPKLLKDIGLLTDDYGIVNQEDLDRNKKEARPVPFSPDGVNSFAYWQCLKPEKYYLSCQAYHVEEGVLGGMTFWILSNGKKYSFGTPKNYEIEACQANIKEIQEIMLNQEVVCVSGKYVDMNNGESSWIIYNVKSKKGMWSLFVIDS